MVAGIIVARSAERLGLLAQGLTDPMLKRFYGELETSEDGHNKLFLRLAREIAPNDVVEPRLTELLSGEAALIEKLPIRAAIH